MYKICIIYNAVQEHMLRRIWRLFSIAVHTVSIYSLCLTIIIGISLNISVYFLTAAWHCVISWIGEK